MEEPLALTDTHVNLISAFQVMTQKFPVPEALGIAQESRLASEILTDELQAAFRQSRRPSGSLSFLQPSEPTILEPMDPVLDRPRTLPQKDCNVIGAQTGASQKHPGEPLVIPGFLGSLNLVLDG